MNQLITYIDTVLDWWASAGPVGPLCVLAVSVGAITWSWRHR